MQSIRFKATWDRWDEVINWCDEMTPGWFFALENHGADNTIMRRVLREPHELQRSSEDAAAASLSFKKPDHFMMFKLAWVGTD